jgi:hypothetical protein
MTISAVLKLPVQSANQALIADGRTRSTLYANVFRVSWLAAGGALALHYGQMMVLVAAVGTMEVPAMVCFWITLERARLLDLREELYGFAAAGAGLVAGFVGNELLHPFVH